MRLDFRSFSTVLRLVANYPHYMATIYRAYHRRADFDKYRRYALNFTLLIVLALIVGHGYYRVLPWVFTIYVIWSPWHYSGQNYGIALMFVQRSGAKPTVTQRRHWQILFVSSYLMLALGFLAQSSADPIVISFGLPGQLVRFLQWFLFLSFAVSGIYIYSSTRRQVSLKHACAHDDNNDPALLVCLTGSIHIDQRL